MRACIKHLGYLEISQSHTKISYTAKDELSGRNIKRLHGNYLQTSAPTALIVKLIKQHGLLLKAMFPKNTAHTLLICSYLSIILSILLLAFIRPPHHLSDFARGVRDRAYPPLRLQTSTLKCYYCRSTFHCF